MNCKDECKNCKYLPKTIEQWEKIDETVAKKIFNHYRYDEVEDYNWWENTYEVFKEDFKDVYDAEIENIYFSGFHSQGDGACFEATLLQDDINNSVVKVLQDIGNNESTIKDIKDNKLSVSVDIKHTGSYYHEKSSHLTIDVDAAVGCTMDEEDPESFDKLCERLEDDLLYILTPWKENLCMELYKKLEDEHEYLTSDEYMKMVWKENNVKFNHHGYMEG